MQAAALKAADFFANDDVLYLMEDMATGEIRLSILWEWLHKSAQLTADDPETGSKAGDVFTRRSLQASAGGRIRQAAHASNRDVHDNSKDTTLPIAREIVETYVTDTIKLPWYIDLLNINLGVHDVAEARRRIDMLRTAFRTDGTRITENLDFDAPAPPAVVRNRKSKVSKSEMLVVISRRNGSRRNKLRIHAGTLQQTLEARLIHRLFVGLFRRDQFLGHEIHQ